MSWEIVMPQLGLSMDSGQIIQWLKATGDPVKAGDILFEVESDKATVEVEATANGTLHIQLGPDDGDIPVGGVVGYVLAAGEQAPANDLPELQLAETEPKASTVGPVLIKTTTVPTLQMRRLPSSPAARRRAEELDVDWTLATPTGPNGRIKERDVVALAASMRPQIVKPVVNGVKDNVSPVARKLADAVGVDLTHIAKQRPNQRIERRHIEDYLRAALQGAEDQTIDKPERTPMTHVRKVIARRMVESSQTNAAVTLTTEADATDLVDIRNTIKNDPVKEIAPSYNAMLARIAALALQQFSELNASIDGEHIILHPTVHVGVAVDTEHGLLVPVVRNVQDKGLLALTIEMNALFARVINGIAKPEELSGSTFTITNLGVYDIDFFTPIINQPEGAVLGIGRLTERVIVHHGKIAIRTMLALSLTFDHRLVDGAYAAQFLQRIKQSIEQPYLWLV